jgi:hypothetical protein
MVKTANFRSSQEYMNSPGPPSPYDSLFHQHGNRGPSKFYYGRHRMAQPTFRVAVPGPLMLSVRGLKKSRPPLPSCSRRDALSTRSTLDSAPDLRLERNRACHRNGGTVGRYRRMAWSVRCDGCSKLGSRREERRVYGSGTRRKKTRRSKHGSQAFDDTIRYK